MVAVTGTPGHVNTMAEAMKHIRAGTVHGHFFYSSNIVK
jgi:hypothetical protein